MNSAELRHYLRTNYGICSMQKCACMKTGWMGEGCPAWKPFEATTFEELAAEQARFIKEKNDED